MKRQFAAHILRWSSVKLKRHVKRHPPVFIERLRRSVKYEDIYLREYATIPELLIGLKRWFDRYKGWRPHETLGNLTPDQVYKTRPSEQGEANAAKGEAA